VYEGVVVTAHLPEVVARRLRSYPFDAIPDVPAASDRDADEASYVQGFQSLSKQAKLLIVELSGYWHRYPAAVAFGAEDGREAKSEKREQPDGGKAMAGDGKAGGDGGTDQRDGGIPPWVARAEEFVAALFVLYLARFAWRLRRLAAGLMITAVLATLAVTAYPFEPEALGLYASGGLTLLAAGAVGYVLVSANKNPLISRVNRTTPNRFNLTWSFVSNALTLIVIPGLFVAAQLSGKLRMLVGPLLDAIH
jgi:hypothetical protein